MENDTTIILLERAVAGDAASRDILFARHAGRLRLYVRHRLGAALAKRIEVDDVCQEAYLRVFQTLDRIDARGESAFYRLLTTVARHVLADAARASRAARRDGARERPDRAGWTHGGASGEPAADGPGPRTRAALTERQRRLERAFETLPSDDRRLIALRQFEQRTAADVARVLGSTEGAIHARYRRALAAWEEATRAGATE